MTPCNQRKIKFIKLKYRVPSAATSREERHNKTNEGEHDADWSGYADDLALFFEDSHNLQNGLIALEETFRRFNLTINVGKTKTMILNFQYATAVTQMEYPKTISSLGNTPVENVKKFRYLGDDIKFDEPSTGDADVNLRIDLAEAKFYELGKKLMNYRIRIKTRIQILNSMVRSRLTYSCQTWNLTSRQKDRVNSTYTTILRKMIKGGYRRKKDNEWHFVLTKQDLHRICGTEDIDKYTARQQKKYLAHLARQNNRSITKQLLFNCNEATKPGRKSTLESSVLNDEECTANEFYRKALKREF